MSLNCRSVRNKIQDLLSLIEEYDLDIVCLQETWLGKGDKAILAEIKEHGLDIISISRTQQNTGGGVAIIHKPQFKVKHIQHKERFKTFEFVIADHSTSNSCKRIISIYRPPYSVKHRHTIKDFIIEFERFLDGMLSYTNDLMIVGDFNIHMERNADHYSKAFTDLLEERNLTQHIGNPTHEDVGILDHSTKYFGLLR